MNFHKCRREWSLPNLRQYVSMYLERLRNICKEIRMIFFRAEIWKDSLPDIRERCYGLKQIARPHILKHEFYPCVRNISTLHTILCQIHSAPLVKICLPWFQSVCYPSVPRK
jgi:hypothetical protein